MKCRQLHFFCLLLFCFPTFLFAHKKDINVIDDAFLTEHLNKKYYSIDSAASAVILLENEYNQIAIDNGHYVHKKVVHRVIKILKDDALHLGNVTAYFLRNDYLNYITAVKASTYNLSSDGHIERTKIEKSDLMKKEVSDGMFSASFSLPAVRVGSVIEYSYEEFSTSVSQLYAWHIQGDYPKLVSIYSLAYPRFIQFTAISHLRFTPKEYKLEEDAENASDTMASVSRFYESAQKSYWIRRNVPAYKEESYVVNPENNKERLEMQVTAITQFSTHPMSNSWGQLNNEIWKDQKLRKCIHEPFMTYYDELTAIIKPEMTNEEKAIAIFKYVRDNYTVQRKINYQTNFININLHDVWKKRTGKIDEINILLVSMLVKAGLNASPIIMSTTSDISPNTVMPVVDRIDYLACIVDLDGNGLLLDASDKNNPAGILPPYCYNGYAWILGNTGKGIQLYPDALKNKDLYGIKITDMTDSFAKIEVTEKYGTVHSMALRKRWAEDKDLREKDLKEIKADIPDDVEVHDVQVENVSNPDTNLVVKIKGVMPMQKGASTFYMNAGFVKLYNKNPFPATKRTQPVEFPYKSEQGFYTTIVLPDGVAPESALPPVFINYDSNALVYKRVINFTPEIHTLTFNTTFAINETWFGVPDYTQLREYFQKVIEDNNQVIVLKRAAK